MFHLLALLVPYGLLVTIGGFGSVKPHINGWIILAAIVIYGLGILVPSLAIAFRRLHDRDISAWWLLAVLIPIISLVLLVFFVLPGTKAHNGYGSSPLAA
ncbi:MAG: DUF805 domain-containing protein [Pseudomonadota bacterium]